MALERDHDNSIFKCGVAVAPVSDWLYYGLAHISADNYINYIFLKIRYMSKDLWGLQRLAIT